MHSHFEKFTQFRTTESKNLSSLTLPIFQIHSLLLKYAKFVLNFKSLALAGVAQWIEHWPVNQRIAGLIPSQGTCLGCRQSPWWGGA